MLNINKGSLIKYGGQLGKVCEILDKEYVVRFNDSSRDDKPILKKIPKSELSKMTVLNKGNNL